MMKLFGAGWPGVSVQTACTVHSQTGRKLMGLLSNSADVSAATYAVRTCPTDVIRGHPDEATHLQPRRRRPLVEDASREARRGTTSGLEGLRTGGPNWQQAMDGAVCRPGGGTATRPGQYPEAMSFSPVLPPQNLQSTLFRVRLDASGRKENAGNCWRRPAGRSCRTCRLGGAHAPLAHLNPAVPSGQRMHGETYTNKTNTRR